MAVPGLFPPGPRTESGESWDKWQNLLKMQLFEEELRQFSLRIKKTALMGGLMNEKWKNQVKKPLF